MKKAHPKENCYMKEKCKRIVIKGVKTGSLYIWRQVMTAWNWHVRKVGLLLATCPCVRIKKDHRSPLPSPPPQLRPFLTQLPSNARLSIPIFSLPFFLSIPIFSFTGTRIYIPFLHFPFHPISLQLLHHLSLHWINPFHYIPSRLQPTTEKPPTHLTKHINHVYRSSITPRIARNQMSSHKHHG